MPIGDRVDNGLCRDSKSGNLGEYQTEKEALHSTGHVFMRSIALVLGFRSMSSPTWRGDIRQPY